MALIGPGQFFHLSLCFDHDSVSNGLSQMTHLALVIINAFFNHLKRSRFPLKCHTVNSIRKHLSFVNGRRDTDVMNIPIQLNVQCFLLCSVVSGLPLDEHTR